MSNIRKTFNFRDGVQVDDEVLVVRGNRVGVGTTSPDELLDVRGNAKVIGILTANNLEFPVYLPSLILESDLVLRLKHLVEL